MTRYRRPSIRYADRLSVIKRDRGRCVQCNKLLNVSVRLGYVFADGGTIHHIVPLVYGGNNDPNNMCFLCTSCHLSVHRGRERPDKYQCMRYIFENIGRLSILPEGIGE